MGLHYLELNSTKVPKYDKVGLVAAKAAALRINLNVQGCVIVETPMHAPSRTPLLLPLLLSQSPYPSPGSVLHNGCPGSGPHVCGIGVQLVKCPVFTSA
jgi:hypothetical protein